MTNSTTLQIGHALTFGVLALQNGALLWLALHYGLEAGSALVIDAAPFIVLAVVIVLGFRAAFSVVMLLLVIANAAVGRWL